MKTGLLIVFLLCSGCATYIWQHPQFTEAGWKRDTHECERDMRQSAYFGGGIAGAIAAGEFQERCLYARGYEKVLVEKSKQPASKTSTLTTVEWERLMANRPVVPPVPEAKPEQEKTAERPEVKAEVKPEVKTVSDSEFLDFSKDCRSSDRRPQ